MESDDNNRTILAIRRGIPEEARTLFARTPILTTESKIHYWSLVESMAKAIGP